MAKVSFTKLGITKSNAVEEKNILTWNDQDIEIKQYLPIQEKLELVSKVIEASLAEDSFFANPIKIIIFSNLEFIFAYTNISFTENQKKDVPKLYDLLSNSGLIDAVIAKIPKNEYDFVLKSINETIESIYKYKNSVLGVLETISSTYNSEAINLEQLFEKIGNPEQLATLKQMLETSGYMDNTN